MTEHEIMEMPAGLEVVPGVLMYVPDVPRHPPIIVSPYPAAEGAGP